MVPQGHGGHELVVVANFYGRDYAWEGSPDLTGFSRILGNYPEATDCGDARHAMALRPYEAGVWYC